MDTAAEWWQREVDKGWESSFSRGHDQGGIDKMLAC